MLAKTSIIPIALPAVDAARDKAVIVCGIIFFIVSFCLMMTDISFASLGSFT